MKETNIKAALNILGQAKAKGLPLNWSQAKHAAMVAERATEIFEGEQGKLDPEERAAVKKALRLAFAEDMLATNASGFRQALARELKDKEEHKEFYAALVSTAASGEEYS
jgi:hypothetical protein